MESTENPLVYLVLGAAGSGRRAIIADLIEGGLDENERALVLLSDREAEGSEAARLPRVERWSLSGETLDAPENVIGDATHVFFVTDGKANPIEQIEAFKLWLGGSGAELGRVICVVNCRLAEANPPLVAWYEACIHFSDVVILTERLGVSNKWISDFQGRFKGRFFPCIFEMLKDGRLKNPPLIIEPQARRMSHFFDETDWIALEDEEGDDQDKKSDEDEEVEMVEEVDPYMERRAGGRRVKEIPDIAKFL